MKSKDLSDQFFSGLRSIALKLEALPLDMLAVMMSESGVRADAHNPNGHASGLIQFMPKTLLNLGWSKGHEEFRKLSADQQLPFVERYYTPYAHYGQLDTIAGLYVATFLPALIKHTRDSSFVLTAKNGPLGWAYPPNSVFDVNHDYAITVQELEDAVHRNCQGPRWAEIKARCEGHGLEEPAPTVDDLRSTFGIQTALTKLGFNPGPIDGIPGKMTRAAIIEFQTKFGLTPDGIYGPKTFGVLQTEISKSP